MKKRIQINGVIIFVAFWVVIFFPQLFLRRNQLSVAEFLIELIGLCFIFLGQLLRASARGYKSENSQSGASLVESGPYNLVRNPMYLGILLIGLGVILVLFNFWTGFIFAAVFIARYLLLIFQEEQKLSSFFGDSFSEYCKKTPRIIPSLKLVFDTNASAYLPLKPDWIKKESNSISAVIAMLIFFKAYQNIRLSTLKVFFVDGLIIISVLIGAICLIQYLCRKTLDAAIKSKIN